MAYIIRIFLNSRELVSGYLISALENSSTLSYDFQKHKQLMTKVRLVSQS